MRGLIASRRESESDGALIGGRETYGELLDQAPDLVGDLLVLAAVLGRVDVVASGLADLLLDGIKTCVANDCVS